MKVPSVAWDAHAVHSEYLSVILVVGLKGNQREKVLTLFSIFAPIHLKMIFNISAGNVGQPYCSFLKFWVFFFPHENKLVRFSKVCDMWGCQFSSFPSIPFFLIHFHKTFILCIWIFAYIRATCTKRVLGAYRSQKWVSCTLDLVLEMIGSCCVGARDWTHVVCKSNKCS